MHTYYRHQSGESPFITGIHLVARLCIFFTATVCNSGMVTMPQLHIRKYELLGGFVCLLRTTNVSVLRKSTLIFCTISVTWPCCFCLTQGVNMVF